MAIVTTPAAVYACGVDDIPCAVRMSPAVAAARRDRAVVALESSVLAQGLPVPANRDADQRTRSAVERHGGITVSARDLGWAAARGLDGATTVAATLAMCTAAGLQVFATGGIGG